MWIVVASIKRHSLFGVVFLDVMQIFLIPAHGVCSFGGGCGVWVMTHFFGFVL